MKLLLTSLLMLLLPSAIMAQGTEEDNYIYDCQVQYSITLGASYIDNLEAPPCSDTEMGAIHDLAVSVVKQDFISALLGKTLPEFIIGWESYEAGTVITPSAPLPSPAEIAEGMSAEDIRSEFLLTGCGSDDPLCEKFHADIEADKDHTHIHTHEEEEGEEDDVRRHLLELTPEEPKAERVWTPLAYLEDENRHLQAMNCPNSRSDCSNVNWCCSWCSLCGRRRRNLKRNLNGCETLRTRGQNDQAAEKELESIKKFERRVSYELTTKLKLLAISGAMQAEPMYTCLGIPNKLFVDFDRHFFEEMNCDDP